MKVLRLVMPTPRPIRVNDIYNDTGWFKIRPFFRPKIPKNDPIRLLLLAAVDPDGNQAIFSRALLDADFGPVGRNQHPARLRERTLN